MKKLFLFFLLPSITFVACQKNRAAELPDTSGVQKEVTTYAAGDAYYFNTPFKGGSPETDGNTYHSYRIPSLVRSNTGTLIAICELRATGSEDYGNIDVVCKRSVNNGETWGNLITIAGTGAGTWGNPTSVLDESNGRIWVFMSWNDEFHSQSGAGGLLPITAWGQRKVYSSYSDDDGQTWSSPVDRTTVLLPLSYKWDAMGPGIGIQQHYGAHAGWLIIPAIGRNIYSEDHGATWKFDSIPAGSSEAAIVEKKTSGILVRNDRVSPAPANAADRFRKVSSGTIGNWTNAFVNHTSLPDPVCQGSIVRYNDPKPNRIMFMNSANQTQRRWPKVRITYDEGSTWARDRDIPQNGTGILGGYTSMIKITKNDEFKIGALIEYNNDNTAGNRSIQFHKFKLSWILNGNTEPVGY